MLKQQQQFQELYSKIKLFEYRIDDYHTSIQLQLDQQKNIFLNDDQEQEIQQYGQMLLRDESSWESILVREQQYGQYVQLKNKKRQLMHEINTLRKQLQQKPVSTSNTRKHIKALETLTTQIQITQNQLLSQQKYNSSLKTFNEEVQQKIKDLSHKEDNLNLELLKKQHEQLLSNYQQKQYKQWSHLNSKKKQLIENVHEISDKYSGKEIQIMEGLFRCKERHMSILDSFQKLKEAVQEQEEIIQIIAESQGISRQQILNEIQQAQKSRDQERFNPIHDDRNIGSDQFVDFIKSRHSQHDIKFLNSVYTNQYQPQQNRTNLFANFAQKNKLANKKLVNLNKQNRIKNWSPQQIAQSYSKTKDIAPITLSNKKIYAPSTQINFPKKQNYTQISNKRSSLPIVRHKKLRQSPIIRQRSLESRSLRSSVKKTPDNFSSDKGFSYFFVQDSDRFQQLQKSKRIKTRYGYIYSGDADKSNLSASQYQPKLVNHSEKIRQNQAQNKIMKKSMPRSSNGSEDDNIATNLSLNIKKRGKNIEKKILENRDSDRDQDRKQGPHLVNRRKKTKEQHYNQKLQQKEDKLKTINQQP